MQVAGASADKTQRKLHSRLGPIVRIAPNEVAISDPTFPLTSSGLANFPRLISIFRGGRYGPSTLTTLRVCDEQLHASRRRIVNNLYSMTNIVRAESAIDLCTDLFMSRMREYADSGEVIDISSWVQMYFPEWPSQLGQLFFSRMFGFLKEGGDHQGYIRSLDTLLLALAVTSVMPTSVGTLFLIAGTMFRSVRRALTSLNEIERAAELCIAERQEILKNGETVERQDIMSSLFDIIQEKGDKADLGLTEAKVEVYVALFAGSDTTAAAVSSILYHLVKNPQAYRKLTDEIRQAAASGELSGPSVQYSEAMKLPYLTACCKEGMRMHPSVGLTLPRNVPKGGSMICGEWFPEGTRVGVNAAVVHRDKTIFGDDANEFRPERWFKDNREDMERHMFQFGGGSRTCIGKNLPLLPKVKQPHFQLVSYPFYKFCLQDSILPYK
ncbi:pisatin demethylase [Fusarium bulbicola]|nr:pisatin demethylase [Fusarium bulbicola]